jgi:hypothetical protein
MIGLGYLLTIVLLAGQHSVRADEQSCCRVAGTHRPAMFGERFSATRGLGIALCMAGVMLLK